MIRNQLIDRSLLYTQFIFRKKTLHFQSTRSRLKIKVNVKRTLPALWLLPMIYSILFVKIHYLCTSVLTTDSLQNHIAIFIRIFSFICENHLFVHQCLNSDSLQDLISGCRFSHNLFWKQLTPSEGTEISKLTVWSSDSMQQ